MSILVTVAPLLKKGGRLVYSTCTIDKTENEEIVHNFLQENSQFYYDDTLLERMPQMTKPLRYKSGQLTLLPHDFGTDGFFIAALRRKES